MKKTLFAVIMALMAFSVQAEYVYINDIQYSLAIDNTCNLVNGLKAKGNVIIPEKVTYNGKEYVVKGIWDEAFRENTNIITITVQGNSLTTVGEHAFYKCESLLSIALPQSVTTIEKYAFSGSGIESFVMPASATSVEPRIFDGCPNLKSVTINPAIKVLPKEFLTNCPAITQLEIPEGIERLDDSSLSYLANLKSLKLPSTLTSIGNNVMMDALKLTRIDLPKSLTTIGENFMRNNNLTSLVLPEGLTTTGRYCFYSNNQLASVSLPSTFTSIGEYTLGQVWEVKRAYLHGNKLFPSGSKMFSGCDWRTLPIYVPASMVDAYKNDENFWYRYPNIHKIVNGDVDGDEKVDVADINEVINLILSIGSPEYAIASDLNGDGKADVDDINRVIDIILLGK